MISAHRTTVTARAPLTSGFLFTCLVLVRLAISLHSMRLKIFCFGENNNADLRQFLLRSLSVKTIGK